MALLAGVLRRDVGDRHAGVDDAVGDDRLDRRRKPRRLANVAVARRDERLTRLREVLKDDHRIGVLARDVQDGVGGRLELPAKAAPGAPDNVPQPLRDGALPEALGRPLERREDPPGAGAIDDDRAIERGDVTGQSGGSMTSGYCPSCGKAVDADDAFCRHCGGELAEDGDA